MTVEEKREKLRDICKQNCCDRCPLGMWCIRVGHSPARMDSRDVEIIFEKLKGDKTMEEKTITIAVSEYRFLISEQSTLSKLEGYAETHEYLSDDVVRALLGVEKPATNLESEGD